MKSRTICRTDQNVLFQEKNKIITLRDMSKPQQSITCSTNKHFSLYTSCQCTIEISSPSHKIHKMQGHKTTRMRWNRPIPRKRNNRTQKGSN